jgi:hypothetical protein
MTPPPLPWWGDPTSFYEYDVEPELASVVDVVAGRQVDIKKFVCGPDEVCAYAESNQSVVTLDEYVVFVMCDAKWITGDFTLHVDYDNTVLRRKFVNTTHCGSLVRSHMYDDSIELYAKGVTPTKTDTVVLAKIHFAVIFDSDTRHKLSPITKVQIKKGFVGLADTRVSCDVMYIPNKNPLYVYPKNQSETGHLEWYCYGPLRKLKKDDIFDVIICVHILFSVGWCLGGVVRTTFDPEVVKHVETVFGTSAFGTVPMFTYKHHKADDYGVMNFGFDHNDSYLGVFPLGLVNRFQVCKVKFKLISEDMNKVHENVFGCGLYSGCELYTTGSPQMTVTYDGKAKHYGVIDGNTVEGGLSIAQVKEHNHALISDRTGSTTVDLVDGKLMYTTRNSEPKELSADTKIGGTETNAGTTTPPPAMTTTTGTTTPGTTTTTTPGTTTTTTTTPGMTSGTTTSGTTTTTTPGTTTPGTTTTMTPPPGTTPTTTTTTTTPVTTTPGTTPVTTTPGTTTTTTTPGTTTPGTTATSTSTPLPSQADAVFEVSRWKHNTSAPTYHSNQNGGDGRFIAGAALVALGAAFMLLKSLRAHDLPHAWSIAVAAASVVVGGSLLTMVLASDID